MDLLTKDLNNWIETKREEGWDIRDIIASLGLVKEERIKKHLIRK